MQDLHQLSHQQLFDAVHAGNEHEITVIANDFDVLQHETYDLAYSLAADLAKTQHVWTGAASEVYRERLGLITTYATELANRMVSTRDSLRTVSAAVARAKRDMPNPKDTDDHDKAARNGLIGAIAGPVITR